MGMTLSSPNGSNGRDDRGRFAKGNPGGPGNPHAARKAWYLAAALAGLRKGDLQRLTWADVDFDAGTITVRDGKAKREDVIPMHPPLADELKRHRHASMALPKAKVFPQTVTDLTRLKDFLRAGIAREAAVTDENGELVMVGRGK